MSFIDLLTHNSHSIHLYNSIFLLSSLLAITAQKNKRYLILNIGERNNCSIRYEYVMSFAILWFYYIYTKTGQDLPVYLKFFEESTLQIKWLFEGGIEPGYRLLNALLHVVVRDSYFGLAIIKSITLLLVFWSIYTLRDEIDIGIAVMAYVALFYFQGFNLVRLNLAGAICIYAFVMFYQKNYIAASLASLLAASIHTSALFFGATLVIFILWPKHKEKLKHRIPFILFAGAVFALMLVAMNVFGSSKYIPNRYRHYFINSGGFKLGLGQIVFYFPIFVMFFAWYKVLPIGRMFSLSLVYLVMGFVLAMLGYRLGILSRGAIFMGSPFVFAVPFCLCKIESIDTSHHFVWLRLYKLKNAYKDIIKILVILYFIYRYVLMIESIYFVSGLSVFQFIWN